MVNKMCWQASHQQTHYLVSLPLQNRMLLHSILHCNIATFMILPYKKDINKSSLLDPGHLCQVTISLQLIGASCIGLCRFVCRLLGFSGVAFLHLRHESLDSLSNPFIFIFIFCDQFSRACSSLSALQRAVFRTHILMSF